MSLIVRERSAGARSIEQLAREAGVHPELVRRLISLGLVDPTPAQRSALDSERIARAVRLRRDLGLNYTGAILACELLDRIEELEGRLRLYEPGDRTRR
jgi:hypothetical protein